MPYIPPADLDGLSLAEISALVAERKLPPVSDWAPAKTGDSEMRIAGDGRWYHQGGEITRPAMVRAFSSLLRRDGQNEYWLVTPQYKLAIEVEDAAFLAVEMTSDGEGRERKLAFRLNSDDLVIAGADNRLQVQDRGKGPMVYLHVRDDLWAKLARPVFYELVELAIAEGEESPAIFSGGVHFDLGALA